MCNVYLQQLSALTVCVPLLWPPQNLYFLLYDRLSLNLQNHWSAITDNITINSLIPFLSFLRIIFWTWVCEAPSVSCHMSSHITFYRFYFLWSELKRCLKCCTLNYLFLGRLAKTIASHFKSSVQISRHV